MVSDLEEGSPIIEHVRAYIVCSLFSFIFESDGEEDG